MKDICFAVDVGTTYIDSCLIDLNGNILSKNSSHNPQSLYGRDVINRIMSINRDESLLEMMQVLAISCIKELLGSSLKDINKSYENVSNIVISGNTTMISILMKYNPKSLGEAPFEPILKDNECLEAKDLFQETLLDCPVLLTGCASAFIGGDILAGLLALKTNEQYQYTNKKTSLLLDLGTNGEMVLNNNGKMYATSTACGPAFEQCLTRQNTFGSSAIDAIALGIKLNKIGRDGILPDEYLDKGVVIQNIWIYSDLLREIILAKAAIITGIEILTKYADLNVNDIETIYLAGSFGFYLNVDSAIEIGLLPSAWKDRIVVVGNTSLEGASILANHIEYKDNLKENTIEIPVLATRADYQERLVDNMNFEIR